MGILPVAIQSSVEAVDAVQVSGLLKQVQLVQRISGEAGLLDPRLDGRSAHGVVHHAHGNARLFLQIPGGEIAHGTPGEGRGIAVQHFPTGVGELFRRRIEPVGDGHFQVPDLVVAVSFDVAGDHVQAAPHGQFHVGLAGAKVHIPHEHILQGATVRFQGVGTAGFRGGKRDAPAAGGIGLGLECPSLPAHLDGGAGLRGSPEGNLPAALHHHPVPEGRGECDGSRLAAGGESQEERQEGKAMFHMRFFLIQRYGENP